MEVDRQRELLQLDYEKSLAAVDKFEYCLLQIQNWSIVTCGAVTAFGHETQSFLILGLGVFLSLMFGVFALLYKGFQVDVMNHVSIVERALQHPNTLSDDYVFGVGRSIRGATPSLFRLTLTIPALWYLRSFYLVLALVPLIGMFFIR